MEFARAAPTPGGTPSLRPWRLGDIGKRGSRTRRSLIGDEAAVAGYTVRGPIFRNGWLRTCELLFLQSFGSGHCGGHGGIVTLPPIKVSVHHGA